MRRVSHCDFASVCSRTCSNARRAAPALRFTADQSKSDQNQRASTASFRDAFRIGTVSMTRIDVFEIPSNAWPLLRSSKRESKPRAGLFLLHDGSLPTGDHAGRRDGDPGAGHSR